MYRPEKIQKNTLVDVVTCKCSRQIGCGIYSAAVGGGRNYSTSVRFLAKETERRITKQQKSVN